MYDGLWCLVVQEDVTHRSSVVGFPDLMDALKIVHLHVRGAVDELNNEVEMLKAVAEKVKPTASQLHVPQLLSSGIDSEVRTCCPYLRSLVCCFVSRLCGVWMALASQVLAWWVQVGVAWMATSLVLHTSHAPPPSPDNMSDLAHTAMMQLWDNGFIHGDLAVRHFRFAEGEKGTKGVVLDLGRSKQVGKNLIEEEQMEFNLLSFHEISF